jgi:alpha-2-macroglobulin
MLEDMFPSGFEAVKEDYNYQIKGESDYDNSGSPWRWRWFFAEKEYRDNRVSFFVTYPDEKMRFTYILRAQIPGKYSISPAEASLMYYPEVNGHSKPENIHIRE